MRVMVSTEYELLKGRRRRDNSEGLIAPEPSKSKKLNAEWNACGIGSPKRPLLLLG